MQRNTEKPEVKVVYIPWLHMHQPLVWWRVGGRETLISNLQKMLWAESHSEEMWNARVFSRCYKNPAVYTLRMAREGLGPRMVLDISGTLLRALQDLSREGVFDQVDVQGDVVGNIIDRYREVVEEHPEAIEFAGTSYYHNYFPVSPPEDWEAQIRAWQDLFQEIFGRGALERVRGFWLPEMGIPPAPLTAALIRVLKRCGYRWIILPPHTVTGGAEAEGQPRRLVASDSLGTETMTVFFRDTQMGIRQQEGCTAQGVFNDLVSKQWSYRGEIPPFAIPTSDGENGNAMMFRFFPETFEPFFRGLAGHPGIGSLTPSQYLERYLPDGPEDPVELTEAGGSWIGGHDSWSRGDSRGVILEQIRKLSHRYNQLHMDRPDQDVEAKRLVLNSQTSCYVYWGQDFWYDQAKRSIHEANEILNELERLEVQ